MRFATREKKTIKTPPQYLKFGKDTYLLDNEYSSRFDFAEERAKDLRKEGYLVRLLLYDYGKYLAVYKRRSSRKA